MFILGFIDYIFFSLALYNLAKSRNLNNAYLAWIPVLNSYAMGCICDSINSHYNKKTFFRIIMLALSVYWFVMFVLSNLLPTFNHDIIENIPTTFVFSMFQPFADGAIAQMLAESLTDMFRFTLSYSTESKIVAVSSFILGVNCIVNFVLHLICVSKIFDVYSPKKSSKYMALYIKFNIIPIIPFIPSVCLWKSSNNKPV